jgi:hypothetical protein
MDSRALGHNGEAIYDEERKIIMFWTPKAACTVSIKMMYDHMGTLNKALDYNKWVHNYRIAHRQNIDSNVVRKCKVRFKVVRNPYARAVSSYLLISENYSFYQFLNILLTNNMNYTQNGAVNKHITYHSIPQYVKNEEQYIDTYIKIENGQREIDEKINVPYGHNLKIDNKTSNHHNIKHDYSGFIGGTPRNNIKMIPKSYKNFYNDTIRVLVEKLYSNDIHKYGYSFDDNF